ncbi:MAG: LmbU family transcriptional regulator [Pseudonocardiaceae bacterium]
MSQSGGIRASIGTGSCPRNDGSPQYGNAGNVHVKEGDGVLLTRVGLRFPVQLTFDEWERAGRQMAGLVNSSVWCLGDWVVYGEKEYVDRYRRAIEAVGLDYQTLRNYAWVARKFEPSRRRERLSFQHHAEVASLPPVEQDEWLARAEERGWSRSQLRRKIRELRSGEPVVEPGEVLLPRIDIGPDRAKYWRQAADEAGENFESWMIASLDFVASQVLGVSMAILRGECSTSARHGQTVHRR